MKKIILGWITHQVLSFVGFILLCITVGMCYGFYCAIMGLTPLGDEALEEVFVFQVFCGLAIFSSSFGGYWFSVKKILKI